MALPSGDFVSGKGLRWHGQLCEKIQNPTDFSTVLTTLDCTKRRKMIKQTTC
jgi:hypothetical protein